MGAQKLKIIFMGTPDFAVPALQALADAGHDIVAVYSQPPRPTGRGQKVQKSPVHECADRLGIPVFTPLSLKKDESARAAFLAHGADLAVVAAYGLILPRDVLEGPVFGCVNIHASLLPRWRGASPIQHAIWAGDAQSGVTIMQMEEGLDTGPMIDKGAVAIGADMYAQDLHDALADMGAAMIVKIAGDIARTRAAPPSSAQDDALSNYAPILSRADGFVDWSDKADAIARQVRALNPWPGVWTYAGGKRLKILAAEALPVKAEKSDMPGRICDRTGGVMCGGGTILKLLRVQPENAKAMDASSALNGHYIEQDMILGGGSEP